MLSKSLTMMSFFKNCRFSVGILSLLLERGFSKLKTKPLEKLMGCGLIDLVKPVPIEPLVRVMKITENNGIQRVK